MNLLRILNSGLNDKRLTGDITRTLFDALTKRLIQTVKTLDEHKIEFPGNIALLLPHKKNLVTIFNLLKERSLLSKDLIKKIMSHKESSKCLAFLIEGAPELTKEQLIKLIDSSWFTNPNIEALLFTNVTIKQETILELIELNDVDSILSRLNLEKNTVPCVRAGHGVIPKHIDWASHQETPSRFNLCAFFKTSPPLPDDTQHLFEWIKMSRP